MSKPVVFQIAVTMDGSGSDDAWVRREVTGFVHGAWGAHEGYGGASNSFRVTHLSYGLATPFVFPTLEAASAAAEEIDALRDDWANLSASEIKKLGPSIVTICIKHGGDRSNGPNPDRPVRLSERVA